MYCECVRMHGVVQLCVPSASLFERDDSCRKVCLLAAQAGVTCVQALAAQAANTALRLLLPLAQRHLAAAAAAAAAAGCGEALKPAFVSIY